MTDEPQVPPTPPDEPPSSTPPERPPPDMASLMVRLAEIRREVEGTSPARRRVNPAIWGIGIAVGLLLATLLFGRPSCGG